MVVEHDGKLTALIYPDYEQIDKNDIDTDDVEKLMGENLKLINATLPQYSQIYQIKIYPEEFEKTPKKSIKRFMYQQ